MYTDNPSSKIFLQELKDQLQRYVDIKSGLDTKANSLIATAGTISVIFVAISTFALAEINLGDDWWTVTLLTTVLVVEMSFTIWAIKSASDAYKAREYVQPIVYNMLFDKKSNQIDDEMISAFTTERPEVLYEYFIQEYILCIKSYQDQNDLQVKDIESAQNRFYAALIPIPFFVGLIVVLRFII